MSPGSSRAPTLTVVVTSPSSQTADEARRQPYRRIEMREYVQGDSLGAGLASPLRSEPLRLRLLLQRELLQRSERRSGARLPGPVVRAHGDATD